MPKLGKRKPKSLKPSGKDEVYWDNEGVKRRGVRVRPNHPATYVLMYRPDARAVERRIMLGLVNEISLPEARKQALLKKAAVYNGIDPLDEKHHKRHRLTFAEAFERHKKERFP